MKRRTAIISIIAVVLVATGFFVYGQFADDATETDTDKQVTNGLDADNEDVGTLARNLDIPWDVVVLPNGDMLVSERPGTLARIGQSEQTHEISGVEHVGEGGLLGVALHPDFSANNWLYIYLTTREDGQLANKVVRYELAGDTLRDRTDILTNIPAASNHNGGRIAFGPDGYLYIGTGDAANTALSQDTDSLAGKILRLQDNGQPAPNNPFDNEVYSYGHRNVQGLAWDDENRLWATEHGPTAFDELNLITRGANYGWPAIRGNQTQNGMQTPVLHSGPNTTWAPSGLAYANGSLYFGGLRGQTLYQAVLQESGAELHEHLAGEYGRLRAVIAHESNLYITTSNTDGRGDPQADDDKLVRIPLSLLR